MPIYGYALHSRANEASIAKDGLVSSYRRTGKLTAAPDGFFAKDRRKREPLMVVQALRQFVVRIASSKGTVLLIAQNPKPDLAFAYSDVRQFATTDTPNLDKLGSATEAALSAYAKSIGIELGQLSAKVSGQYRTGCLIDEDMSFVAPPPKPGIGGKPPPPPILPPDDITLLNQVAGNKNHFLTRLATLSVRFTFDAEELQTTTHVYMTKPGSMQERFSSYLKVGGTTIDQMLVLRIDLDRLRDRHRVAHEPDPSDQNAYRVKDRIPEDCIAKWLSDSKLVADVLTGDDDDWQSLERTDFDGMDPGDFFGVGKMEL